MSIPSTSGWDAQAPAIGPWLAGPTETMFAAADIRAGHHVLDVAAGAGEQTLALAARAGPSGRIVATDLSPALIERLRRNTTTTAAPVEARVADAQAPLPEVALFDAAVCRLGLMLMPNPARCLAATYMALKPGGRFAAMVFAGPVENQCIRILMSTIARHAGLPPRDPFASGGLLSLGRPGDLDRLFRDAGFREVAAVRIEAPFRLPSVDDYVAFLHAAAAPVRAVLACLSPSAREAAWCDMRAQLSGFDGPYGWTGPNTLLVAAGKR
jgi:SAM-dependent methyltransferase